MRGHAQVIERHVQAFDELCRLAGEVASLGKPTSSGWDGSRWMWYWTTRPDPAPSIAQESWASLDPGSSARWQARVGALVWNKRDHSRSWSATFFTKVVRCGEADDVRKQLDVHELAEALQEANAEASHIASDFRELVPSRREVIRSFKSWLRSQ